MCASGTRTELIWQVPEGKVDLFIWTQMWESWLIQFHDVFYLTSAWRSGHDREWMFLVWCWVEITLHFPNGYFRRLVGTPWSKTACGSSAFLIWWNPGSRSCRPTSSPTQSSPVSVWRWLEPTFPGSTSTLSPMTGKMVVTRQYVTVDGVFHKSVHVCVGLWTCYSVRCRWRNSERRRVIACWKLLIKGWTRWIKLSWWSLCVRFCSLLGSSMWNRCDITVEAIVLGKPICLLSDTRKHLSYTSKGENCPYS